jgi:UDP:flavonoid glycosyltransferase YjiC (YdhE family)
MQSANGSENHIFAAISGPFNTRAKLTRIIIPTLTSLEHKSVISLGEPGSQLVRKIGNCQIYGWLNSEERKKFMRDAKMVVFSGGHGTCFEVIKHEKPSICIPTQSEQMGNARKMQELGCSISVANGKQFKSALQEIDEKIEFYKRNVHSLFEYSSKFVGLETATTIIESTALG